MNRGSAPSRASDDSHEALRLSEERFHQLVDAITDYAIFMLDADGYVSTWNVGAQRIKGYDAEEIVGQHFSKFYPEEQRAQGVPARILQTVRDHGRFEDEGWRVRKDGSRFWASVVITALRDVSGAVVGFAKVTRDLSERRLAEQQIRSSEERLRFLLDAVVDYALYMLDPDGRVTTWNAGAQRLKGYKASEIVGQHFEVFFPPEDIREGKPTRELAIARDVGRFEDEGWRLRQDGSRFWADVIVSPVRDEAGELLGFAKVTRDSDAPARSASSRAQADRGDGGARRGRAIGDANS
ncbi:MAG: PAS domain-containing protein [Polyangiaceae bacterium]